MTWGNGYVPENMEERLFLARYDPSKFPITVVTVDIAVLAPHSLLLVQRGNYPYRGRWAFPGGFMDPEETAVDAAVRELREEAGLHESYFTEGVRTLGVADDPDRDPRGRAISILHGVSVDKEHPVFAGDDAVTAKWFDFDAVEAMAFNPDASQGLAFDHADLWSRVQDEYGL